jgi:hypothetical protein
VSRTPGGQHQGRRAGGADGTRGEPGAGRSEREESSRPPCRALEGLPRAGTGGKPGESGDRGITRSPPAPTPRNEKPERCDGRSAGPGTTAPTSRGLGRGHGVRVGGAGPRGWPGAGPWGSPRRPAARPAPPSPYRRAPTIGRSTAAVRSCYCLFFTTALRTRTGPPGSDDAGSAAGGPGGAAADDGLISGAGEALRGRLGGDQLGLGFGHGEGVSGAHLRFFQYVWSLSGRFGAKSLPYATFSSARPPPTLRGGI